MKRHKTLTTAFILLLFMLPLHLWAQSAALNVPYYVQGKESPWADEVLGNKSSVTIRTYGCALTCISMVTSHFSKKELNPSYMNSWLKKNNGYHDGWNDNEYLGEVNLNWPALAEFEKGWVYTRFDWKALPADLLLIKYYLNNGIPVIAEVLYREAPHYVVLTGWDDEGFIMNDPEFPDEHRFSNAYDISDKWGSGPSRNIYGIRILYPAS
ncbi:MAG: C39 family peptidase [Spirochaetales bacterium]|nr:C39 family peptidase [Spirochaetales bacterium]